MMFDYTNWKILALKVGIFNLGTLACNFKWLWPPFVERFCTMDVDLDFFLAENLVESLGKKFQK